jgi:hypothetical protein
MASSRRRAITYTTRDPSTDADKMYGAYPFRALLPERMSDFTALSNSRPIYRFMKRKIAKANLIAPVLGRSYD